VPSHQKTKPPTKPSMPTRRTITRKQERRGSRGKNTPPHDLIPPLNRNKETGTMGGRR